MGATTIGTGINADPNIAVCTRYLAEISGIDVVPAANLIEATGDADVFIMNSSVIKRLAVRVSNL